MMVVTLNRAGLARCPALGRTILCQTAYRSFVSLRAAKQPRSTLSKIWIPTGGISEADGESGHEKLVRAGFVRQTQSGIFQLLPLGLRVQHKLEKLLDHYMQAVGASRVSLSAITSEKLWRKSGRLDLVASELFRLTDRKQASLMLSPTHEEEITALVASTLQSYKDLPLRLYQITQKYRDEMRPRHGLLRSRDFLMKDLYTFDLTVDSAIDTYHNVSAAYRAFFSELKLPVMVAEASSGDMGGDHSHEYHLAHPVGEDTVAQCDSCGYTANDEVAVARPTPAGDKQTSPDDFSLSNFGVWRGITKDRKTLVNAWYPLSGDHAINNRLSIHAVKAAVPDLDTSTSFSLELWKETLQKNSKSDSNPPQLLNILDSSLSSAFEKLQAKLPLLPEGLEASLPNQSTMAEKGGYALNLLGVMDGDACPRCDSGALRTHRALELGHTFHLGTRYSEPLGALVSPPQAPKSRIPVQMGCYGIGLSRIIGAIAEFRADQKGLNWPRAIAPFEVVIVPSSGVNQEVLEFYDMLAAPSGAGLDVILDDRKESFGWKMRDADMIGYPVSIILGKSWRERGICELQCKSLSVKEEVPVSAVSQRLDDLLSRL